MCLAACGGSPPVGAPSGVVTVELGPQTNPAPATLPAHSLWNGRYICAQGITGLTLTLDVDASEHATAVFDFGAVPENPSVPTGRYLLAGYLERGGGGGVWLRLAPDRWITRPPGYEMVGLTARIDASARTMRGNVDYATCTVLELARVR
jgi:hypothetical protein